MKNGYLPAFLLITLLACHDLPNSDKTVAGEKQKIPQANGEPYNIDTTVSKVNWLGTKVNGSHKGSIPFLSGTLGISNSEIKNGKFTLNLARLINNDLPIKEKEKIESHLKSADFFNVVKHPLAFFEITKVELFNAVKTSSVLKGATHVISGNLTLKGLTKNVTFPAKVNITNNLLTAKANFLINRNDWGMTYKGANNPQDWLIRKEVNLQLDIVAKKQ